MDYVSLFDVFLTLLYFLCVSLWGPLFILLCTLFLFLMTTGFLSDAINVSLWWHMGLSMMFSVSLLFPLYPSLLSSVSLFDVFCVSLWCHMCLSLMFLVSLYYVLCVSPNVICVFLLFTLCLYLMASVSMSYFLCVFLWHTMFLTLRYFFCISLLPSVSLYYVHCASLWCPLCIFPTCLSLMSYMYFLVSSVSLSDKLWTLFYVLFVPI